MSLSSDCNGVGMSVEMLEGEMFGESVYSESIFSMLLEAH